MSFNTALTGGQLTHLRRRRWSGDQYISFCDNAYALAASVSANINLTSGTTAAAVPFGTVTVGAYTNVTEGMTVILSPTSDIRDFRAVRLHVRYLNADSGNIYVSEFSDPINIGWHVWVLYHFDLIDNLSRPVGTSPVVQYEQYDQAFQRMAPVIRGLQTGYASWVDAAGHYDIAFDISTSFAAESGATISSYAYSVTPTGAGTASVIAGSAVTATVTYRFTYGEYFLKAVVTDSNGVSSFRHCLIKAHDRTNYLPSVAFDGAQITRDVQQGQSAKIKGYSGVSSLINGTMVIIWVDEQYSDIDFSNASGSIFNNIDLVGWIELEENMFTTDPSYSGYADVSFEVQGLASRLSRLEGQMLAITNSSSPTLWDQINNLTVWRSIVHFLQRHTTALQLGDFAADSVDNTFLFPTIVTLAGRALDNVTGNQGIANEICGQVEFASDGRMQLIRREPFVATDLSHTPIIVATWTGADFIDQFKWSFNHYQQYGMLDGDGAAWSGVANVPVMPCKTRAPGLAQGSGADQGKLNNQILASTTSIGAAQSELAQRAGTEFALLNANATLTVNHPAQFHWLQPSMGQVYIWSLDSSFNIRGLALDSGTHWMLKSLTVQHDNKSGSRTVSATYVPVVTGNAATNIPIITTNSTLPSLPILPPMPAFTFELPLLPDAGLLPAQIGPIPPPGGQVAATDGNSLLVATASKSYWISNFIALTTPKYIDTTPTDLAAFALRSVAIDPFFSNTRIPAYLLASDGTNSAVWAADNEPASPVLQVKGGLQAGDYTIVRATNIANNILIYSPTNFAGAGPLDYDATYWLSKQYFFFLDFNNPNTSPTFSFPVDAYAGAVGILIDGNASTIPNGSAAFVNGQAFSGGYSFLSGNTVTVKDVAASATVAADFPTYNHPTQANTTYLRSGSPDLTIQTAGNGVEVYISLTARIIVQKSIQAFPGSSSTAPVAFSSDKGATWSFPTITGSAVGGVGGFDVQRAGGNSFCAINGKISRATTIGGNYSDYYTVTGGVQAVCIVIPYFNWAGTKQTDATNPDIIVGLSGADGSSRTLLWIEGGATAGTVHDITPVAGSSFDNANAVTVSYNHHLAVFCLVGGFYKLYRSTNKGSSWSLVGTRTAPKYIRTRRNDSSGAVSGINKGQLYMADTQMYWSSLWDSTGPWIRNMPSNPILSFDTLF